jgi:hypothetical protein
VCMKVCKDIRSYKECSEGRDAEGQEGTCGGWVTFSALRLRFQNYSENLDKQPSNPLKKSVYFFLKMKIQASGMLKKREEFCYLDSAFKLTFFYSYVWERIQLHTLNE